MEFNLVCIIQVINKIGRWHSGSPNCFIKSMITDQTGQHNVLLPINHNYDKICDILGFFKLKTPEIPRVFFASSEKCAHAMFCMVRTVQLQPWCVLYYFTVLLVLKSGQLKDNQIWEFYIYILRQNNRSCLISLFNIQCGHRHKHSYTVFQKHSAWWKRWTYC